MNGMYQRSYVRRLVAEQLETRAMLAGNVNVSKDGDTLVVRGDGSDNGVFIQRVDDNRYQVTGVSDLGGDPTSINGVSGGSRTVSGVKHIEVRLRGGDDLLGIGQDTAALQDLAEELAGLGTFTPGTTARTFIRGRLEIQGGSGADAVGLFVKVNKVTEIDLGDGQDSLAIEASHFGDDLLIEGGSHIDNLRVRDTFIDDLLFIDLQGGADELSVQNVEAHHAIVEGGSGGDVVEIDNLDVNRELKVFLEDGDDELTLTASRGRKAILRGGSGDDTLIRTGNDFNDTDRSGFET